MSMIDDGDVEAAPEASDKQLKQISTLVQAMVKLQGEVDQAQAVLKDKMQAFQAISEVALPEAMSAAGYTAPTKMKIAGMQVEFVTKHDAHISKDRQAEAYAWLEKNGHGDLIKHAINITFGKDEEAYFKKFIRDLAKRKKPVKAEIKDSVHTGTLGAFVREKIAAGDLPEKAMTLLGVFIRRYVTAKPV